MFETEALAALEPKSIGMLRGGEGEGPLPPSPYLPKGPYDKRNAMLLHV